MFLLFHDDDGPPLVLLLPRPVDRVDRALRSLLSPPQLLLIHSKGNDVPFEPNETSDRTRSDPPTLLDNAHQRTTSPCPPPLILCGSCPSSSDFARVFPSPQRNRPFSFGHPRRRRFGLGASDRLPHESHLDGRFHVVGTPRLFDEPLAHACASFFHPFSSLGTACLTLGTNHVAMVEKNPWYSRVDGPFPSWQGPVGVKEDGGGCTRGRGRVSDMRVHRAVNNRDKDGAWCSQWTRKRERGRCVDDGLTRRRNDVQPSCKRSKTVWT